MVGNDYVAKAPPDGYTVLVAITQIIQAPSLVAKLPYDVFKDLAPVTQVGLSTIVLMVPEAQPISRSARATPRRTPARCHRLVWQRDDVASLRRTLEEERRHRHDPRSLSRGGSLSERSAQQHGDGRLPRSDHGGAQIAAGKIRALAVGGEKRRTQLPNVPTLAELVSRLRGRRLDWRVRACPYAEGCRDEARRNWPASSPRPRASPGSRRSV